ncbi:MAG TPA: hypothetical protein DCS97_13700, partial [Planctomycetes bacterium]|nr:hypothetical protein [Planctomycetota bacterium]
MPTPDVKDASAVSGRRPIAPRDPARIWPRLGPTLLNAAIGQADLASLERAQRAVCAPGSPLAVWQPGRAVADSLKRANASVSRLVARGARADAAAWEEFADAFHLEPAERWDALRDAALAWLAERGLRTGGRPQAAPTAVQAAPPASLPSAAAEGWARLVPRLIESGRDGRVGESLRGVCDHYARAGWDPGPLASWVPSATDCDLLLAAEALRKHLFSSPPSQQTLIASEFLAQVQQLSLHGPLLMALAQTYLDSHRIGAAPRNRGGGRGGGGGGGRRGGRGG